MDLTKFLLLTILEAMMKQPSSYAAQQKQLRQMRPRRRLVWHDEFNTNRLDDRFWKYEEHCGRFNHELQCYTKHRLQNARVRNGMLVIEARPERWQNGYNFTSARLLSKKSWTYGRFNIRARMPKGLHLWPAIWMLAKHETYGGWPTNGEIDIAEVIGNTADVWSSTIHYGPTEQSLISIGSGVKNFSIDLSHDFHVFSLDWNPKRMIWLLDGRPYFRVRLDRRMCCKQLKKTNNDINVASPYWKNAQPFDKPFYLILNVAVGGTFFGPPPYVTPQQAKQQWQKNTMDIDYVRVYQ